MTRRIVLGVALATPFAFLLLPEPVSDAINGTLALAFILVAVMCFTVTGVLAAVHWWQRRTGATPSSAEDALEAMGYADTRNARQQQRGRHGPT